MSIITLGLLWCLVTWILNCTGLGGLQGATAMAPRAVFSFLGPRLRRTSGAHPHPASHGGCLVACTLFVAGDVRTVGAGQWRRAFPGKSGQ
jgi:hypothetical protein